MGLGGGSFSRLRLERSLFLQRLHLLDRGQPPRLAFRYLIGLAPHLLLQVLEELEVGSETLGKRVRHALLVAFQTIFLLAELPLQAIHLRIQEAVRLFRTLAAEVRRALDE